MGSILLSRILLENNIGIYSVGLKITQISACIIKRNWFLTSIKDSSKINEIKLLKIYKSWNYWQNQNYGIKMLIIWDLYK